MAKMVSDITGIDYKLLEDNVILETNELPVSRNKEKAKKCDFILKINEDNIRPIVKDDNFYAHQVELDAADTENLVENFIRARKVYKGTGTPAFYTTTDVLLDMLLLKDKMGRRLYNTQDELAKALRVSKIVEVEVMEGYKVDEKPLLGVMVNLNDYTLGADKGGQISMFDDFDIDYNQYKYLMETRASGALTIPKSALVFLDVETATGE